MIGEVTSVLFFLTPVEHKPVSHFHIFFLANPLNTFLDLYHHRQPLKHYSWSETHLPLNTF